MEEQEFEEILTYLARSKYPESINTKDSRSNWRKKCRPFTHCKHKLYYNHKKYGALLVVKGVKSKKKIIESNHIQSDDHHIGINKTLKKIITHYYWKTIAKDVHNYIKLECSTCIKQVLQQKKQTALAPDVEDVSGLKSSKKIVDKAIEQIGVDVIGTILEPGVSPSQEPAFKCETGAQANMQPLILRDHIMAHCGLDVIGPLSETHKGRRFLVIVTDCVTKWVEAKALSELTTDAVGEFISEVVCRHGAIEEILSKQNSDFCNRLAEKVCSTIGITVQMSNIPSQSNGYLEHYWYNNLLCSALIKYSNQNQYYWDVYLNQVILAYRTFHQKNTAWSPFQLMYERSVRLPTPGLSQPSADAFPDEQEALLAHMNNYIKALSCQPPGSTININNERINSSFLPSAACIISSQHQPAQVLGSYAQTGPNGNQINSNLSVVTSLGPNLQTSVHNSASLQPVSNNSNLTAQTTNGNNMTTHNITANSLNTQAIPVNTLGTHTISTNALPAYTISANNVNQNVTTNNNQIATSQAAATHVITPQVSATQSTAVQAQTHLATQATADAHSGHMVMIHTDGKAYPESFYVICPQ
ncbi:uncharacterized protein LOC135221891 [Macrobrachium nipponense]|uniref:uncharacterized protein LOC135221891 n=1 Tax=Macrobrachium nipponense TaxID=159736 RepID=UPI0030C7D7F0